MCTTEAPLALGGARKSVGRLHDIQWIWNLQNIRVSVIYYLQAGVHYAESLPKNLADDIIDDCKNKQWDDEPWEHQANEENGKENNPHILQDALNSDG